MLHLELQGRRRRGSRHRRRHHRDVHPEHRRGDLPDDLLREPDEPNVSASHLDSGEEASSPGSGEVRPGLEPDAVRPGLEPDGFRPAVPPGELHPDRVSDVRRHPGEEHPVPDEEPDVRQERTSTGCYRREVPSDPVSVLALPASGLLVR